MRPVHPCMVCGHATPAECSAARGARSAGGLLPCASCECLCLAGRGGSHGTVVPVSLPERPGPDLPDGVRRLDRKG